MKSGDRLVLTAQPLTPEAFAPYGDVIAARGDASTINQGSSSMGAANSVRLPPPPPEIQIVI